MNKTAEKIYQEALKAKSNPDLDVNGLAEKIIATKDANSIFLFAKNVIGAPIDKLAGAIIDLKDEVAIISFLFEVKGAPKTEFVDYIMKNGSAWAVYCLAKNDKYGELATFKSYAKAIIERGETEYISKLVECFEEKHFGVEDEIKMLKNAIAEAEIPENV